MKRIYSIFTALILTAALVGACDEQQSSLTGADSAGTISGQNHEGFDDYVVVANRGDSTLAVLDSASATLLGHITSEHVGFDFEATYVAHLSGVDLLAVTERAENRVLVFDSRTLVYYGAVDSSAGLFHNWTSEDGKSLYAVANIDNVVEALHFTRSVDGISFTRDVFDVEAAIPGGVPHDVVADDSHFYVSVQQPDLEQDTILKVRQDDLSVEGSLIFSLDTHLGMPRGTPFLLVPEQTDGELNFVNRDTFEVVDTLAGLAGAHGIATNDFASRVFIANTPSDGEDSFYDVRRTPGSLNAKHSGSVDLDAPKAHNVAVDFDAGLAYVTHSGGDSTDLAVISINGESRLLGKIEVGVNPFGLVVVHN